MRTLASFANLHQGETIVVCGCGESLNEFTHQQRFVTIGVNDVGRRFTPNYLVVVNPRNQFTGDRFSYVENSQAQYLFTQLNLGLARENVVKFQLGTYGGTGFANPKVLHHTQNSPYVGLCLAMHMGASRIGLIGVDFTEHHFFAPTGTHLLSSQLSIIDEQYRRLYEAIRERGVEVFNLSSTSRLTAFPKLSVEEFAKPAASLSTSAADTAPLKIVSYATTPVAGVPAILARCINARTQHAARCVWAQKGYGNGVVFTGDVEWTVAPEQAAAELESADVVIVHNGKVDQQHRALLAGKAIVTMAHNYMWNVDAGFVQQGFPGVVVGQYQATLQEFKGWSVVPNPVPLWEEAFQPCGKQSHVAISYTPSGKHETFPAGHQLYWHAKGYETTMRALERLASRFSIRLEVIRDRNVSHAESLAMKRRAHIVIDECATGSYHRSSLEGLACGCVVVNGVGLLPGVAEVFHQCAGNASGIPFRYATLGTLESELAALVERGPEALAAEGASNRQWIESHWDFSQQWERFWQPVLQKALERAGHNPSVVQVSQDARQTRVTTNVSRGVEMISSKQGVSVIIPHGGRERLPHLAATLANLRQCEDLGEIIVIDMGEAPYAEETARRFADKYVFVRHVEAFQRARALNIGTPFAAYDLLLWNDNDVILPVDFIVRAAAELRTRQLDSLIPYTAVCYLSAPDSQEVMAGTRNPTDCRPVNLMKSREGMSGASALVKKQFVLQYGGFHEGFRGWGGDDNAWSFKAQLLGRSGVTQFGDRYIYHLFHPHSGGYGGNGHILNNPHYNANVALMNQIFSTRNRNDFLKRFPAPEYFSCPWGTEKTIAFITDDSSSDSPGLAQRMAKTLSDLYGVKIDSRCAACTDSHWQEQLLERTPDAMVLFGSALARQLLTNNLLSHLWSRVLIAPEADHALTEDELKLFSAAGAVLTADAGLARTLQGAGLRVWVWDRSEESEPAAINETLALAQPLSIILGGGGQLKPVQPEAALVPHCADKQIDLPVWLYWEGECPDWIKLCQRTIFAHAPDVRLVTPAEFEKIRDIDGDIDLSKLLVEHRADFIRALLLMKFGGLWIDSDCLVMQPLQPLLNLLHSYDFIFHKERSGYVSNGFIGARPGSKIASTLYRRICEILRSGQPLGWLTLGGELLTNVIASSDAPYHELKCELIQPVCWSQPEAFFNTNDDPEHEHAFNEQAICYMLANNAIQRFQASHPGRNLLDQNTFFRYLSKRALEERGHTAIESNRANDAGSWEQIPFCIKSMLDVSPLKVLDVGIGFGRWGMLVREFCEASPGENHGHNGRVHLVGVETSRKEVAEHARFFYDQVHIGDGVEIVELMTDKWDLVIFDQLSQDWVAEALERTLNKALDISDYVLVSSPVVTGLNGAGDSNGRQSLSDLLSDHLVRYARRNGRADRTGEAFLLSRTDPKRLRTVEPMQRIFEDILKSNLTVGEESVSGPGSSLAQTAEIRRRLPFLIADLKVRSLLDTPCGDFNWMKNVRLGLEEYIGGDIVPALVEQNQKQFGDGSRRFLHLDITRDHLPLVDLILCRDCLVHFPLVEVADALRNFKRSGSKYLLTTTFTGPRPNTEIATGDWRTLNLQLPPFNFPPPLRLINEKCTEVHGRYADKCLGLWKIQDLPI